MSTPKPSQGAGDLTSFNVQHGFAEALVRGMRSSFLVDQDYHHLTQCETLDDVRLNLTETDYADAIADFNTLTPNMLQKAAVDKVRGPSKQEESMFLSSSPFLHFLRVVMLTQASFVAVLQEIDRRCYFFFVQVLS